MHKFDFYNSSNYKFKKTSWVKIYWPYFAGLVLIVILAIIFIPIIFSQKYAQAAYDKAEKLVAENKITEAGIEYETAAKKTRLDSNIFANSIKGLLATNNLEIAKKITEEKYKKESLEQTSKILAKIYIAEKNQEKLKNMLEQADELEKIAYEAIFESKIKNTNKEFQELSEKINQTANPKTKQIILAQYYNENKNPEIGAYLAKNIIVSDASYRDAYITYGYSLYEIGRLEEAKGALITATQIDPVYTSSFKMLAEIYKKAGDAKNAKACADKAKELAPK